MNIFNYNNYIDVFKFLIEREKNKDSLLNYSTIASEIGVQKTYISKILNGSAHLSLDQAYDLAKYFSLTDDESDYFQLLLEHERSGLAERKKGLLKKIIKYQTENRSIKKHLKSKISQASVNPLNEYYLNPLAMLLHVFISLPKFQKNPELINKYLRIPKEHFRNTLALLETLQIIKWNDEKKIYILLKDHMQLPKESNICKANQGLLRLITAQHLMTMPNNDGMIFQLSFTSNEKTKNLIHDRFLSFLREAETLIRDSNSEEVFQMNFELFPWLID